MVGCEAREHRHSLPHAAPPHFGRSFLARGPLARPPGLHSNEDSTDENVRTRAGRLECERARVVVVALFDAVVAALAVAPLTACPLELVPIVITLMIDPLQAAGSSRDGASPRDQGLDWKTCANADPEASYIIANNARRPRRAAGWPTKGVTCKQFSDSHRSMQRNSISNAWGQRAAGPWWA